MKPLVFACMPSRPGVTDVRSWESLAVTGTRNCILGFGTREEGSPCRFQSSLLTQSFNYPWCMALNLRERHRIDYWVIQHDDVECEEGWIDLGISELRRTGASAISAVIPIKIETGVTSTGLGLKDVPRDRPGFREMSRKLTLQEVHKLPETFSAADTDEPEKVLLINTGALIIDFRQPWIEEFTFRQLDANIRDPETGRFHAETRGEDWNLSYFLFDRGLPYFATRKIKCRHNGQWGYVNYAPWGQWETDHNYRELQKHLASKSLFTAKQ